MSAKDRSETARQKKPWNTPKVIIADTDNTAKFGNPAETVFVSPYGFTLPAGPS